VIQDELYRIGRDVLRKAFPHARARRIEVEVLYGARAFRLRIRDNGIGIGWGTGACPESANAQN